MKRIFIRMALALALIVNSLSVAASEINAEDWLLWYETETQMPFSSSLSIYPPVTLQVKQQELIGTIATPYALSGSKSRLISEFLIVVIDGAGRSHFLEPTLDSVGFVGEQGIAMSSLVSESFVDGMTVVRFYRANTEKNRAALRKRQQNNKARKAGIESALSKLDISEPVIGQKWAFAATTLDGNELADITESSQWTIVQLYSSGCGFCRKAIPLMNELNDGDITRVVGLAGPKTIAAFEEHINRNDINYPFIAFQGEYTESALLQAMGQLGFPTYFVLDTEHRVDGIYVGTRMLEKWLATRGINAQH